MCRYQLLCHSTSFTILSFQELRKDDFVEMPISPRSLEDNTEKDAAADPTNDANGGNHLDDIDVELGAPAVVFEENDAPQNEEEINIFQSDTMMENAYRVRLPVPGGVTLQSNEDNECGDGQTTREVPNGCAVCMDPFCVGDRICWSSNAGCPHAFHEKCLINWLLVLGRRRRMRMLQTSSNDTDLTDYDMLCPCCRQDFVKKPGIGGDDGERLDSQDVY